MDINDPVVDLNMDATMVFLTAVGQRCTSSAALYTYRERGWVRSVIVLAAVCGILRCRLGRKEQWRA